MALTKRIPIFTLWLLLAAFAIAACNPSTPAESVSEIGQEREDTEIIIHEQNQGPVHARIILSPKKPKLGIPIELTLEVKAPANVNVRMPNFGEQLGRFHIIGFKPETLMLEDGGMLQTQAYTLDLPMSGKLRVPSFYLEFTDHRENGENVGKVQELLTDDFAFEVESLVDEEEGLAMLSSHKPRMEPLPEIHDTVKSTWWIWLTALGVGILAGAALYGMRKKPRAPIYLPHEIAMQKLGAMQKAPIPTIPEAIDAWYVELSSILRHYIEGRFGLSAPKRTTEEFFILASSSNKLTQTQQVALRRILEKADKVKFTEYLPDEADSLEALKATQSFVVETSPSSEEGTHSS